VVTNSSTSSQGYFTSALNTKLSGIETGATADQTAAQLLASIKTVDVNGSSGINAGRLDGLSESTFVRKTGSTMTGYLTMSYDHFVNRSFNMTGNGAVLYIILCRNAGNNNVNGRITMARTSGLRHACQLDIIVSAGSSLGPVGTMISHGTTGYAPPSYRLVTCTYNSASYIAVEITNPDSYYDTNTARFNGRIKSTGSELVEAAASSVSSVAAFSVATASHQINGHTIWHAGNSITKRDVTRVTAAYTVVSSDQVIFCNTDSTGYSVYLPAGTTGRTVKIINTGSGSNSVTVIPNGSQHLLGSAYSSSSGSQALSAGQSKELTYHSSDGWY